MDMTPKEKSVRKRQYYIRYRASITPERRERERQKSREYYQRNVDKRRAESRAYAEANREKVLEDKKAWYRRNKERLHELRGVTGIPEVRGTSCEICGGTGRICLDHDHTTNQFRGWLCQPCNTAIGMMKDDPAILHRAAIYVEKPVKVS